MYNISNVNEYRKLLDIISEKFITIDEIGELQGEYYIYTYDLKSITRYFKKMNELVKKIISNPKYTEKVL